MLLPFPVAQWSRLPAMQEIQVQSMGWEDPMEEEIATHSSILAWRIPWKKEPGELQSIVSQRVRCDWVSTHQPKSLWTLDINPLAPSLKPFDLRSQAFSDCKFCLLFQGKLLQFSSQHEQKKFKDGKRDQNPKTFLDLIETSWEFYWYETTVPGLFNQNLRQIGKVLRAADLVPVLYLNHPDFCTIRPLPTH